MQMFLERVAERERRQRLGLPPLDQVPSRGRVKGTKGGIDESIPRGDREEREPGEEG